MGKILLKSILSNQFIKFSIIPILVVELTLIILYFSINKYISTKNTELMLNEATINTQNILKSESDKISEKLSQVSQLASILQKEHESIFAKPENFSLPNGMPVLEIAPNGVIYKVNEEGSSLYYSSNTKITEKEKKKVLFTESMDTTLKNVVDTNPLVVASYFNSWDDMNRLYPFIPKVYEQYGAHINMEDYNFYYLADLKHNPSKKTTWTGAYLDPAGNGWMLSCVVPIYKGDFLEGVTGLDITIDSFVKNILDAKLPYDAKLFMVDSDGMIIAMPEKIESILGLKELKEHLYTDVLLKTIEKPEEYNLLKNKSPFAAHFKSLIGGSKSNSLNINGNEYLTLMQNIDETNWKMMVLVDKKNIFGSIEELEEFSNNIGYIAISLMVIFYGVFFYLLLREINAFSNEITKPIVDLSTQTTQMANKNIEFTPIDTNISEISKLSDNFNYMIKELKTQANELNNARIIAESANKAKDEFLANVSHELKTPLNSINVLSEIMSKNKSNNLDEANLKKINIISKCAKDLSLLINDVLDLSKIDAGKIELNINTIDLKVVCNDIYNSFEQQMNNKNLNFKMNIDDSIDYIVSDDIRVSQILKNLLSNALKFTSEGKKIEFLVKDEDNKVKFVIKDEGIGIQEDRLENIFDRFTQVDSSISRKYGGTGLGLTITKQLVDLLGGEIFVSSSLDKGTTFEVLLPKNSSLIKSGKVEILMKKENEDFFEGMKEKVIFYNSKPLENMTLVIDLKKQFEVVQIFKFDELLLTLENTEFDKLILDEEKTSKEEVDKLKEIIAEKLTFISNL